VKVEDLPIEMRQETPTDIGRVESMPIPTALLHSTGSASVAGGDWTSSLVVEVERRLQAGVPDLMDGLARDFEAAVVRTTLRHTHGRRIDAATRLGVGRNTITRKIQELQLED
jgi:two-component system nitrogen regulation response regulator GlnG